MTPTTTDAPPGRLAGRVAVVTGSASGIGAAIATRFRAEGATVVGIDRDPEADVTLDVTDPVAVRAGFDGVIADHGTIDVLVTSAGIAHIGTVTSTTEADFDRVYAVNVKGVYLCMQAALAGMGEGGAICNIASIASMVGIPDRFAYSMSKGAVLTMTLSASVDLLERGIRVNAISPARVHTPFVDRFIAETYPGQEAEMFETLSATQPMRRMGTPAEVASLALYLCSDEAGFVTGANMTVDGGFTGVRP